MAILPVASTAPCVNIPDWFIKEGGELCLSESRLGFSILRYWPHFVTEEGNDVSHLTTGVLYVLAYIWNVHFLNVYFVSNLRKCSAL